MKNIIYNITAAAAMTAAALFLPGTAHGQHLNPTVEVSRQYRGNLGDFHKPVMKMALPDSVEQFNLAFDYSVFENPYRGSYEFRPYLMDIEITPGYNGARKLYLNAGAGYSLHPELDVVWSPVTGDRFRLSVYGTHRSYIGRYHELEYQEREGSDGLFGRGEGHYKGYDMVSKAGVSGALDWKKGVFCFDAAYYGQALRDTTVSRCFDGIDFKAGVSSKESLEDHFVYDVNLRYRYNEDKLKYTAIGKSFLTEHDFTFDATLGKSFRTGHAVLFDLGYDMGAYGASFDSYAGKTRITPRYLFSNSRWRVNIGAELVWIFGSNGKGSPAQMNARKSQIIYPDVRIDLTVVRKFLDIYLAADGGADINPYSSMVGRNRHITPLNTLSGAPLLDNTVERVSAIIGLDGNISTRFRYDLHGGYRNFASAPVEALYSMPVPGGRTCLPAVGYTGYQSLFAKLDYTWLSQDVKVNGFFMYEHTDLAERSPGFFAPAEFTGYADVEYNWKKRIFVGVDCGFATGRSGGMMVPGGETVPVRISGYADLGAYLEFSLNRKFSLWCKGGNLLDMTIQKTPAYAESGINFTVGLCLNL